MFKSLIKLTEDMRSRLIAGRDGGTDVGGHQRVSGEELAGWEVAVRTTARRGFGPHSPQAHAWQALVEKRADIVSAAMAAAPHDSKASMDGSLDYLNRALGLLSGFQAEIDGRGGVGPSPLKQFYAWQYWLPGRLRIAIMVLIVALSSLGWFYAHRERPVPPPQLVLGVSGKVPARTESIVRDFAINDENNTHNLVGTNTERYAHTFDADAGYRITEHVWQDRSSTRVSNLIFFLDGGGGRISMGFQLSAGPQSDRYRGWLRGTLHTTQVRTIEPETRVLVERLPVSGASVKEVAVSLDGVKSIQVSDSAGSVHCDGRGGHGAAFDERQSDRAS